MPRWVKILLILASAVALIVAIGMATGLGGEHGPGRHGAVDTGRTSLHSAF
jgi:hypothetical protein